MNWDDALDLFEENLNDFERSIEDGVEAAVSEWSGPTGLVPASHKTRAVELLTRSRELEIAATKRLREVFTEITKSSTVDTARPEAVLLDQRL